MALATHQTAHNDPCAPALTQQVKFELNKGLKTGRKEATMVETEADFSGKVTVLKIKLKVFKRQVAQHIRYSQKKKSVT